MIPLMKLSSFKNHPYIVSDDEKMMEMVEALNNMVF